MGLVVFAAIILYLLISIGVVIGAIIYARKHGKSAKRWGVGAALVMYLLVFWDHIPTLVAHKYYCEKEAGFWIYKTLDQWKAENPGVAETLLANELRAPSIHEGDEDNWTNTYVLNQRINQVSKHQGPLSFHRWKYEVLVIDNKTKEVLARLIDFYTAQERGGGGWHGWKFWLATNHCSRNASNQLQFGDYVSQIKGAKK